MNNNKLNKTELYYPLTDIDSFKEYSKNSLIEYTNNNHSDNYGLVSNILYKEMNDLIDNIETVTDNKLSIRYAYVYITKDNKIDLKKIDNMYPEPVKNAFNNCINYFSKSQNI